MLVERFSKLSPGLLENGLDGLALMTRNSSGNDDFLALEELRIRAITGGFGGWSWGWGSFGFGVGFDARFRRSFGRSFSFFLRLLKDGQLVCFGVMKGKSNDGL